MPFLRLKMDTYMDVGYAGNAGAFSCHIDEYAHIFCLDLTNFKGNLKRHIIRIKINFRNLLGTVCWLLRQTVFLWFPVIDLFL